MGKVIMTVVAGLFIMALINSGNQEPAQSATAETSDQAPESETPPQMEKKPDPEPKTALPPPSPWRVSQDTSPIDDSKRVWLTTKSNELIPHRYRRGQEAPARLQLRCMENTTALYISFNDHHMASSQYHDWGDVIIRVDSNKARTISMSESTDNSLLGLFRGGQSIPVIRSMFGGEKLLVKATPFNESPITVTFPIQGLQEKIKPLREACHW